MNQLDDAQRPRVLVSASAVGFYGTSESNSYDESSAAGNDYLAKVRAGLDRARICLSGSWKSNERYLNC